MIQQVVLQNLFSCNPVAPVANGIPQRDKKGCITGYTVSHKSKGSKKATGSSDLSGIISNSGNSSSTITSGNWKSASSGEATSQWDSATSSSSSGGFQSSSSSSSFTDSNWASSSNQLVTNTGAYYTDDSGNTHEIILDKESRGFWRGAQGNSHRLESEQNSTRVYFFTNTQGQQKQSLNVDEFGRLSVTNQMTGKLEDVQIDQTGRAYFINQSGVKTYLIARDNHHQASQIRSQRQVNQGSQQQSRQMTQQQTQGAQRSQRSQQQTQQTQKTQQSQDTQQEKWGGSQTQTTQQQYNFGSQQIQEGKLYFKDQFGNTHQLFIDSQGGYWMDSQENIHAVTKQGTAFFVNKEDTDVKLIIDSEGQVGVQEDYGVDVVEENREGSGFYENQFGQKVLLVDMQKSSQHEFETMQDRSQLREQKRQTKQQQSIQQSQKQFNQSTQSTSQDQSKSTDSHSTFMQMGKMYYVDENKSIHEMFITQQGAYTKNSFGQETQCTTQGRAYYVDFQHQMKSLSIDQFGQVSVMLSGHEFKVDQNTSGFGYIMDQQHGMFLGSNDMSQFQAASFTMENQQSTSSFTRSGDASTEGRSLSRGMSNSSDATQQSKSKLIDHLFVIGESGDIKQLQINGETAFFFNSQGQAQKVNSNMQAFVVNSLGEKTTLMINQDSVYYTDSEGNMEMVKENNEGLGYYLDSQGSQIMISQDQMKMMHSQQTNQISQQTGGGNTWSSDGTSLDSGRTVSTSSQQGGNDWSSQGRSLSGGISKSSDSKLGQSTAGMALGMSTGMPMPVTGSTQGMGEFGSFSSKLSAKGGKSAPAEPANCSPVAYVTGGIPKKDSKGCIVSYTVGLQLLMI